MTRTGKDSEIAKVKSPCESSVSFTAAFVQFQHHCFQTVKLGSGEAGLCLSFKTVGLSLLRCLSYSEQELVLIKLPVFISFLFFILA